MNFIFELHIPVITSEDILPGFSQPLKNKIQIVIDTSVHEQCDVYMSTGSASDPLDINTGLAYYNAELKRFEPHGHNMNGVLTGSNANIFRSTIEEQTGSFQVIGQTRQQNVKILSERKKRIILNRWNQWQQENPRKKY